MFWMLLAILAMAAFANGIRCAQRFQADMRWAGMVCYLTAATACGGSWALNGRAGLGGAEALYGAASGLTIAIGYFLFSACIRSSGIGVAQVFERLSMIVAAGISIVLWRNTPGALLVAGLVLAVLSIPLIAGGSKAGAAPAASGGTAALLTLLLITGAGSAALEAYKRASPSGSPTAFLLCQYVTIWLVVLGAAVWKRGRPGVKELAVGLALGALNILFYYSSLRSLGAGSPESGLPGTVVFPTIAVGTILASAGSGALFWRERHEPRTLFGMALAAVALILINC